MADFDLLVLGDANPDLILVGDVEAVFGQAEKLVEGHHVAVGGSGAIMACGAARLGLRTAFAGVVGDDAFGRFMISALAERGIDTHGVRVDSNRPTGLSVVLAREDDRATLTSLGTIGDLSGSMIDPELIAQARHVHVSSYYLQRALQPDLPALFDAAHAAGSSTSIDPNWDPAERWESELLGLLSRTDCFL